LILIIINIITFDFIFFMTFNNVIFFMLEKLWA